MLRPPTSVVNSAMVGPQSSCAARCCMLMMTLQPYKRLSRKIGIHRNVHVRTTQLIAAINQLFKQDINLHGC